MKTTSQLKKKKKNNLLITGWYGWKVAQHSLCILYICRDIFSAEPFDEFPWQHFKFCNVEKLG